MIGADGWLADTEEPLRRAVEQVHRAVGVQQQRRHMPGRGPAQRAQPGAGPLRRLLDPGDQRGG